MNHQKLTLSIIPFLIIGVGIMFIIFINLKTSGKTDRNRAIGTQNNTYVRVVACLASTSPTKRTAEYVKACYDSAEAANHITVERYGDGK